MPVIGIGWGNSGLPTKHGSPITSFATARPDLVDEAGSSRRDDLRRHATPQAVHLARDMPAFGFAGPVMRPEM